MFISHLMRSTTVREHTHQHQHKHIRIRRWSGAYLICATSSVQTMKFDLSELNCIRFPKSSTKHSLVYAYCVSRINAGFLTCECTSKHTSSINKSKLITWWIVQFLRQAICVFLFYHITYILAIFQSYFGVCFTRNDILSLNILRYSEMLCMKLFANNFSKFCFSTYLGF